jgi:hypothetical protein
MQVIFEKRLTSSEKERHWIIILAKARDNFPAPNVDFDLRVGDEVFSSYIDSYNRLRLGSRAFGKLELDEPGAFVIFEKKRDREYVLKKKKN